MIEIKKVNDNKLASHDIYINGKLFTRLGYYEPESKLIGIDDTLHFDVKKIAAMKAQDFPGNFCLSWTQRLQPFGLLKVFGIIRQGKKITIEIGGGIDLNSHTYDWLLWNPYKLMPEICRLAKSKGYTAEIFDPPAIRIDFDFKAAGTLGTLFDKAFQKAFAIQLAAEKNMQKLAAKRLIGE